MAFFDQVIKRPALTIAVAIGVAAIGGASVFGLERGATSAKTAVAVTLIYAGAEATEIERTLVNPIEARMASAGGVSRVESTARPGTATVTVWPETGRDLDEISTHLAESASAVAKQLGSRVGMPSIVRLDSDLTSASTASVRELAPTALAAAMLTLVIILMLLRSQSGGAIVASAVGLALLATLGVLLPAGLTLDASAVVGLMLASILIVGAALRARDAFGRNIAMGLQRRTAALAAAGECGRGAAVIWACAVTLLGAFVIAAGNAIPVARSIATITVAGATSAVVVAAPIVLALSSVWIGPTRSTPKNGVITGLLYVFDTRLDRIADRYHEILAWTLDKRRVTSIFALSTLVLGVALHHAGRAIAPTVDLPSSTPPVALPPIRVALRGPDWLTLSGVAQRVAEELKRGDGVANVRVSAKPQDAGTAIADVFALSTDVSPSKNRLAPEDPDIVELSSPLHIDHLDGDRVIYIDVDLKGSASGALSSLNERLASVPLPPQYLVTVDGQLAETQRATRAISRLLALAAGILTIVLAWHLRSVTSVMTVLLTLGVAALGAIVSISAAGLPFDVLALLGGAAALAVVASRAISAVDSARGQRGAAVSTRVLVIEAARIQFRPLVTTTLAALGTLLPLILFAGRVGESYASLGMAALGGILLGAVAVLFALPTFSIVTTESLRRLRGDTSL